VVIGNLHKEKDNLIVKEDAEIKYAVLILKEDCA